MSELKPCAMWTPDLQGKQDYDGRLMSISCRYWPAAYGDSPSAHAAITFNYGSPYEPDGYADSLTIAEAEFEAGTENEVKARVEAWVQDQFWRLARLLANCPEFPNSSIAKAKEES